MKISNRIRHYILLTVVLVGLIGSVFTAGFVAPEKAYAAGEVFTWKDYNTITLSGGDTTGGPWDLKLSTNNNLPATQQEFRWMGPIPQGPTHKSGCHLTFRVIVTGSNSGRIDFPQPNPNASSGHSITDPNTKYCWATHEECILWVISCDQVPTYPGVRESYHNQTITINGTRPDSNQQSEPPGQRMVMITIRSPRSYTNSPENIIIDIKKGGELVVSETADRAYDYSRGQDAVNLVPEELRPASYTKTFYLDPGDYQVCERPQPPRSFVLSQCQSFTKKIFEPLTLTFGEGYINDALTVIVELTFNGSSIPPQYQPGEADVEMPVNPLDLRVEKPGDANFSTKTFSTGPGSVLIRAYDDNVVGRNYTTFLRGYLSGLEPGVYRVCVANTSQCQEFTKVAGQGVTVTLTIGSAQGNLIIGGTLTTPTIDICAQNAGDLGWWACPMTNWFQDMIRGLDDLILDNLIKVNACRVFNTSKSDGTGVIDEHCRNAAFALSDNSTSQSERESSDAFYKAWQATRNIAYALLVILGLVMVVSQIAGLEVFDAYAIRKMLPRLVLAAIFIPLLWPILREITVLANNSADAVQDLIRAPFLSLPAVNTFDIGEFIAGGLTIGGAAIVGLIMAKVGGVGVFLALLATVFIAIFQAFIVIALRDMIFFILVIASPVAVALATFQPFARGFALWRRLLTGILLSIPAIAAVLTISKVAAAIATLAHEQIGVIFAIIFIVAGFISFWPILKSTDKLTGQIDGLADKATGFAQKWLSDYRSNTRKRRWAEFRSRQRGDYSTEGVRLLKPKTWLSPHAWTMTAANQANILEAAGKPGGSYFGAARQAAEQGRIFQEAQALLENDQKKGDAGSSGNTSLMQALTIAGVGEEAVIRKKVEDILVDQELKIETAKKGRELSEEEKRKIEDEVRTKTRKDLDIAAQNFGGKIGTHSFAVAAALASASDNTAWRETAGLWTSDQARDELRKSLARLVDSGVVNVTTAAKILTTNKARLDLSGGGFGAAMEFIESATKDEIAKAEEKGKTLEQHLADTAEKYDQAILAGNDMTTLLASRWETARVTAQKMRQNIKLLEVYAALSSDAELNNDQLSILVNELGKVGLVDPQSLAGRSREEILSLVRERAKSRNLLKRMDSDEELNPDQALSRYMAITDSAYQQLKYRAPQNAHQFSDYILADDIYVPVIVEEQERIAGVPTGRAIRKSVLQRTRVAEDISRRKLTDPDFPLYGYEYSRYHTDPRLAGAGVPGSPNTPPGPGGPGAPGPGS